MTLRRHNEYIFEVELNWLADTRGILTASDAAGSVHVATPPAFGGEGRPWTPEHLFLSAISSCYMSTYLFFTKKLGFEISDFECKVNGRIELVDGAYRFTQVDLYPIVFIEEESLREKALLAMSKTHKHCLVTNSVGAPVFYHTGILVKAKEHSTSCAVAMQ